jgi:hypothetical protein
VQSRGIAHHWDVPRLQAVYIGLADRGFRNGVLSSPPRDGPTSAM